MMHCVFDFIEDNPQQPAIEEPTPDDNGLEDVTSISTELEDDPLMVSI